MDGIEIRWLDGEALRILDPIIQAHGWAPLNPKLSRALVAYAGLTIVGFSAFSCIPHVEPIWLATEYRASGLKEELIAQMVEFLYSIDTPEAYIVASNPHIEALAIKHGMERVNVPVYYKRGGS